MSERDQLAALQAESARLITRLEGHGIEWRLPPEPAPTASSPTVPEAEPSRLSTAEKVALFRRLLRGRADVYPIRRKSKSTGKSGCAPACGNEWLCPKKRSWASDLKTKDVKVPQWCDAVRAGRFTGSERGAFEAGMAPGGGNGRMVDLGSMRARPAGLTLINRSGRQCSTRRTSTRPACLMRIVVQSNATTWPTSE